MENLLEKADIGLSRRCFEAKEAKLEKFLSLSLSPLWRRSGGGEMVGNLIEGPAKLPWKLA